MIINTEKDRNTYKLEKVPTVQINEKKVRLTAIVIQERKKEDGLIVVRHSVILMQI